MNIIELHEKGFKYREDNYKELFDLEFWKEQESYKLIKQHCTNKEDYIIEIGCLTGHHLILLEQEEYTNLVGIDFVPKAIQWANQNSKNIEFFCNDFNEMILDEYDKIILFDILEHQHNVKDFLKRTINCCHSHTDILFLVPKGEMFMDEGHVNFYPSCEALTNLLNYYFKVVEVKEVDDNKKIFARCKLK